VVAAAGLGPQRLLLEDAQFLAGFDRPVQVQGGEVAPVAESGGVGEQVVEGDRLPVLRAAPDPAADRVIEGQLRLAGQQEHGRGRELLAH